MFPVCVSNLCGDVLVTISDLYCHVIVGASRCIKSPGDQDGSCVSLDVKVLLLIATCWQGTDRQTLSGVGTALLLVPRVAIKCDISDNPSHGAGLILNGCSDLGTTLQHVKIHSAFEGGA